MTLIANDNYGRTVDFESTGTMDTYTVTDPNTGSSFSVSFTTGTPQANAYGTINSMPATLPAQTAQQVYTTVVQNAINGFNTMMVQFAVSNILLGITQAGKTQLIADTLADVMRYGQSGSLYAVISALEAITPTSEMSPYLNSGIISSLILQTEQLIANL